MTLLNGRNMRGLIAAIVIVGFFGTGLGTSAQMSSSNYEIRWDTVGNGGNDTSSSASYILRDTAGGTAIGDGESSSYKLQAGYRQGVFDQAIEFSIFSQHNDESTDATASVGNTITCSPAVFAVGDMVALVQDVGASQVAAVGQIISVGVASITLDDLAYGDAPPVIDGTNDKVYPLEGWVANLETLDTAAVNTAIIGVEVNAEVDGGYVVQVASNGGLNSGVNSIDAVADGAVTAGSEEYGGRSSDTALAGSTFDTADTAFTTSFQDVADTAAVAFLDRNFLTLKGSAGSGTEDGSYSQTLTLVISGNF